MLSLYLPISLLLLIFQTIDIGTGVGVFLLAIQDKHYDGVHP